MGAVGTIRVAVPTILCDARGDAVEFRFNV